MLQKYNLLVDACWVVEESVFLRLINGVGSLVFHALDIDEVEEVCAGDYLRAVVEEDAEGAVGQFVTEAILGAEVDKFYYEFVFLLLRALVDQSRGKDSISNCALDLSKLLVLNVTWLLLSDGTAGRATEFALRLFSCCFVLERSGRGAGRSR